MDWRLLNAVWVAPLLAIGGIIAAVVGAFLLGCGLLLVYLLISFVGALL